MKFHTKIVTSKAYSIDVNNWKQLNFPNKVENDRKLASSGGRDTALKIFSKFLDRVKEQEVINLARGRDRDAMLRILHSLMHS